MYGPVAYRRRGPAHVSLEHGEDVGAIYVPFVCLVRGQLPEVDTRLKVWWRGRQHQRFHVSLWGLRVAYCFVVAGGCLVSSSLRSEAVG